MTTTYHASTERTETAGYVLRRRRGTRYIVGMDWDLGTFLVSSDRYDAMVFATADAARTWAKENALPASDWKILRRVEPAVVTVDDEVRDRVAARRAARKADR